MTATNRDRQEATLRRWLEALPDELIRARPVLSNAYAGTILTRGVTEGAETRLRDAERWLDAMAEGPGEVGAGADGMVVVDQEAFRRLPGTIAIHRAGQARLLGDVAGTIFHARRALDFFGDDEGVSRRGQGVPTPRRGRGASPGRGTPIRHGLLAPCAPVTAVRARLSIAQRNLAAAWTWARDQGLSADDELTYVREFEHGTLARLMLAQAMRDSARTADRVLPSSSACWRLPTPGGGWARSSTS